MTDTEMPSSEEMDDIPPIYGELFSKYELKFKNLFTGLLLECLAEIEKKEICKARVERLLLSIVIPILAQAQAVVITTCIPEKGRLEVVRVCNDSLIKIINNITREETDEKEK